MRAAVLDGAGGIDIRDLPVPVPAADEVVIAPVGTGVCGTDLHLASGEYPHGRFPVVPGGTTGGTASSTRTTPCARPRHHCPRAGDTARP